MLTITQINPYPSKKSTRSKRKMKQSTPKIGDFSVGSTNVIKNITQEIIRECNKINITVDDDLVSYAANLLSLDPSFGLRLTSHFDRNKLEGFVNMCVQKFANETHPSLKTLGMQAKFMLNPIDSEQIINEKREQLKNKTAKLTKEIIDANVFTKEDHLKLIKKMSIDVIIYNGLGSPGNSKILSETMQALQSIMSKSDMASFCGLHRRDKMNSLKDIREIVCGIRVFNRDAGYPSDGVIDLPYFVEQTCESTKSILDINLFEIMDRVNLLTSAISSVITFDATLGFVITLPEDVSKEEFEILKDVLIMNRQQELYVRNLIEDLLQVKIEVSELIQYFRKLLEEIHETVQYKTAVPTELVFPKFGELGRNWLQLQNQIFVLSQINLVNTTLTNLSESVTPYDESAYKILGKNQIETDDERMDKFRSTDFEDQFTDKGIVVQHDNKSKIELLGFCVISLAVGNGILLPGNPRIGVGIFNNKFYSSKDLIGLKFFEEESDQVIYGVIEAVRKKPELIVFLNIFEQVRDCQQTFAGKLLTQKLTLSSEVACQTELHPIPKLKDKDYTWNIWELRRKAIQLANIRKSDTHSVQTDVTYENYATGTQTSELKNQECQSKMEKSTMVGPCKKTYSYKNVDENYLLEDGNGIKFLCNKKEDKDVQI